MYEGAIQDLIDELGRLPGIGPKSAQRIAFHIIQSEKVDISRFVEVLRLQNSLDMRLQNFYQVLCSTIPML